MVRRYEERTVKELREQLKKQGKPTSGNKKELIQRLRDANPTKNSKSVSYKNEKIPPNVVNKELYLRTRNKVKKEYKVWPSAYASAQLVKRYKAAGGKYSGEKTTQGIDRWMKEKWVDLSRPKKGGGYYSCGREKASVSKYPYCRPTVKVSKSTPMTVSEIKKKYGKKKIDELIRKKRTTALPQSKKSQRVKGLKK